MKDEMEYLKKKYGACVFWAPYFSKFFGGKIERNEKELLEENDFKHHESRSN